MTTVVDRIVAWTCPRRRACDDCTALQAEVRRLKRENGILAEDSGDLARRLRDTTEALELALRPVAPLTEDAGRMRPRRTHFSHKVFRLPGGTEDNDLWTTIYDADEGGPAIGSLWEPTNDARAAIAAGHNVELVVFSTVQQPVALRVVDYPIGKRPEEASE